MGIKCLGVAGLLTILVSTCAGCNSLLGGNRPQMPTEEWLADAELYLQDVVSRAEEHGVFAGPRTDQEGVGDGELQYDFAVYSRLARDFPEDRGRVGVFISDVLVPGLLRACDATRRDLGPTLAGNIEPIIGELFQNRMAMEQWHEEVERRLVKGEGFTNLYWARVLHSKCAPEEMAHARERYEIIFQECRDREGGCDQMIIAALRGHLEVYSDPKKQSALTSCR